MPVRLVSNLPEIIADLDDRANEVAKDIAQETSAGAKALAPVETGDLKRSLRVRKVRDGYGVYAIWYWFLVEFGHHIAGTGGTRQVPARPYLIPAFEKAYLTIEARAKEHFGDL